MWGFVVRGARVERSHEVLHLPLQSLGALIEEVDPFVGLRQFLVERVEEIPLRHQLEFQLGDAFPIRHTWMEPLRVELVNQSFHNRTVVGQRGRCSYDPVNRGLWLSVAFSAAACTSQPSVQGLSGAPAAAATGKPAVPAEALPEVDTLVARWVKAVGGDRPLRAAAGYRATGRFEGTSGLGGTITVYYRAPDKIRSVLQLDSGDIVEEGHDGERAWSSGPNGVWVQSGEAADDAALRADLMGLALRYTRHFPERRCVGKSNFEGHSTWKVEVKPRSGSSEHHFFDMGSGRLVGLVRSAPTPAGDVEIRAVFSDWRRVGRLDLPFEHLVRTPNLEQRVRFDEVVLEVPSDEDLSAPEDVRSPG